MKTSANETISASLVQLLVNLWYIHIICLRMAFWCTQALILCYFGPEKPQLEERLCTPVWQTTLWQQQMPQRLSMLMVTTTVLLNYYCLFRLHHVLIVSAFILLIPQMTKIKFLHTILKNKSLG